MGIYSEKLIQEAKRNRIDTSKNDFSEVDNQIESMLVKLRDEYGIDIQGMRNSILHKMENNIESFIDSTGNVIISGITNTLSEITKEALNEKKISIDVENSRVEKEQLDTIEKMAKEYDEPNTKIEYYSFDDFWKKEAEKAIDALDRYNGKNKTVDPNALGVKNHVSFVDLFNADPNNPEELKEKIIRFCESDEVTPEERAMMLEMLENGENPLEVRKRYMINHSDKMKVIIDLKIAEIAKGKMTIDEFSKMFQIENITSLKKMILSEFPELRGTTGEYVSYKEAIELNVVDGAIGVATREIEEINGKNTIEELRKYCASQNIEYAKKLEELGLADKDEETQIDGIKSYLSDIFYKEKSMALYKKSQIIQLAKSREAFVKESEFFKAVSVVSTEEEFQELVIKYNLQDLGLSMQSINDEEFRNVIIERLDETLAEKKANVESIDIGLDATSTAIDVNKLRHNNEYRNWGSKPVIGQSELWNELQSYNLTTDDRYSEQERLMRQVVNGELIKNPIDIKKKYIKRDDLIVTYRHNGEKNILNSEIDKNDGNTKEDERKIKEKASFEAQREVAFFMKKELGDQKKLREIIEWQTDYEEFKREYLEKVFDVEAEISEEDFEKIFMLKETLKEKDKIRDSLLDCETEQEFEKLIKIYNMEELGLKFGEDLNEFYTEEDFVTMIEISKTMESIKTKDISLDEEIQESEEKIEKNVNMTMDAETIEEPESTQEQSPNSKIRIYNKDHVIEVGNAISKSIQSESAKNISQVRLHEGKNGINNLKLGSNVTDYLRTVSASDLIRPEKKDIIFNIKSERLNKIGPRITKSESSVKAIKDFTSKSVVSGYREDEEYLLDDFADYTAMIDEFEMELEQPTEQPVVAVVDKKITGPASLAKAMAKPKEMVLDYMEMNIGSGTDPKNATLVMADMLRDNKLLTKFKGASEQGITLEEYSEIMAGVVVETEAMIAEGKLPAVISENGQERETTIDDFINMTFDDTEILLSNLPERPQGLDKEEVRSLIESQVLEAQRLQEQHAEENLGEGEKTQQELAEMLKAQQREKEVEQAAVTVEKEVEAKEAKITDVTEAVNQEVVQEEKVVIAKEEEPVVEEIVQEEPKVEQSLTVVEEKSLAQKVGGRLSGFFQSAKEKVSKFVENIKEKLSGSNSDKNFGSEVFAMDATKGKKNKSIDDQWGTVNVDIKAARESAKEIQEAKQAAGNEKETVSVSERNDD